MSHPDALPTETEQPSLVDCKYVIYGKIIVDDIVVAGTRVRSVLGGGGPQAAFGARLWSDSVGFVSRSGSDLAVSQVDALRGLDIDLAG